MKYGREAVAGGNGGYFSRWDGEKPHFQTYTLEEGAAPSGAQDALEPVECLSPDLGGVSSERVMQNHHYRGTTRPAQARGDAQLAVRLLQ
jgi:hypothetical protein